MDDPSKPVLSSPLKFMLILISDCEISGCSSHSTMHVSCWLEFRSLTLGVSHLDTSKSEIELIHNYSGSCVQLACFQNCDWQVTLSWDPWTRITHQILQPVVPTTTFHWCVASWRPLKSHVVTVSFGSRLIRSNTEKSIHLWN